jgi:hypothetical protein
MTEKHEKHIHKLRRHTYKSGNATYFCAMPDCSFKISPPLAIGKRSICWRCERSFILNEYSVRLAKPHCEECHKPKGQVIQILDLDSISDHVAEFIPSEQPKLQAEEMKQQVSPALQSLKDRLAKAIQATDISAEDGEI